MKRYFKNYWKCLSPGMKFCLESLWVLHQGLPRRLVLKVVHEVNFFPWNTKGNTQPERGEGPPIVVHLSGWDSDEGFKLNKRSGSPVPTGASSFLWTSPDDEASLLASVWPTIGRVNTLSSGFSSVEEVELSWPSSKSSHSTMSSGWEGLLVASFSSTSSS